MASPTESSSRGFRPPATPLVTVDPYFSVWSMSDRLTDDPTRHWTGAIFGACGMAYIDGKAYRFMGPAPAGVPVMEQASQQVHPTRSVYRFRAGGITLTVTFMTPLLLQDMDIMSRPASYVGFDVRSDDRREHQVSLYLDVTGEWVVNTPDQQVEWSRVEIGGDKRLQALRMGSRDQPVLGKSGDDLRIDWGYLYLAFVEAAGNSGVIASSEAARGSFAKTGEIPKADDLRMPRSANDEWPVMACSMKLGAVGPKAVSRFVVLAYDDGFSVEYLHRKLRPYWRRSGMGAEELIRAAVRDYGDLRKRCEAFDREIVADAEQCGGSQYADIVATAYRQAIAAHKLVADPDGRPLLFSKENFSNGCMGTVDVSYPASPIFLLFSTELLRALLEPILDYSGSTLWPFPFAPHDIGTYPLANGQVYGGGAESEADQMPVEESGNMLIMLGAMSCADGNARYAERHWDVISKWAAYLKAKGLDPENQLCTDDFAGHLAHNANLSLKAIVGLACYSMMADMLGKKDPAAEYRKSAEEMAAKWKKMADDGDHYRLAFDQPGTWSMKYNLVWNSILKLNLFDPQIARTEVASYKKRMNPFGLPLDNREAYTKADWLAWTATLAESDEDFRTLVAPLHKFLNESPSRVPFSDWYWTTDGKAVHCRARSVVGGMFIKMLTDSHLWAKWRGRAGKDH